jgi:hypothetical protein
MKQRRDIDDILFNKKELEKFLTLDKRNAQGMT